ncbi:hypothetical protein CDL15_Pgr007461 [Punica granatum]|uniref:Uncharacterized protein n=1 Tax=Punica granatum TaxID=22663 RepID=A0A218X905_PUNGR|nr:hypothetical protein CDL15_Pgr007461 [Punica granatum]
MSGCCLSLSLSLHSSAFRFNFESQKTIIATTNTQNDREKRKGSDLRRPRRSGNLWRRGEVQVEIQERSAAGCAVVHGRGRFSLGLHSPAGASEKVVHDRAVEPADLVRVSAHFPERVEEEERTRLGRPRSHREAEARARGPWVARAGGEVGRQAEIQGRRRRWRRGGGVDGAALARAARGVVVAAAVLVVELAGRGEVGLGLDAAELSSGRVVRTCRLLGSVEGPEPDAGLLPGVTDLGRVPSPRSLPHSPVPHLLATVRGRAGSGGLISRGHFPAAAVACR